MSNLKKIKKTLTMFLAVVLMVMILPANTSFANEDIDIISSTILTEREAKKWAKEKGATETFVELADLYWSYYKEHGNVNPAVAYVQAAIETGFGKFGGVLDESYKNPCGLKNPVGGEDLDPNAHFRFESWEQGVKAHLDHLSLYAGNEEYPRSETYDPRHFGYLLGQATTVQALSGTWATDKEYGNKIIKNYKELYLLVKKESKMWIDEPINGGKFNNELKISGWGLNDSGVKEVKVYIDGKYVKNLESGLKRSDINSVYPGYANSENAGFEGKIDLTEYAEDYYSLRVDVIGNDGSISSQYVGFDKFKKESKMWVDEPTNGEKFNNELKISGWGLNDSGVKEVKAYIDGKYVKNLESGLKRSDINSVYPGYINSENAGFEGKIDLTEYVGDYYSLRVDVIGNDGSISSQYVGFNKIKKESKMWVESPENYSKTEGNIKISGWALNDSGVNEIKLYVDGRYIKNLNYGLTRFDVNNAYPGYINGKNSGFEGILDLRTLKAGKLNLRIDTIGNDKSVQSSYLTIINNKINAIDAGLEFDFGLEGPQKNNPQKLVLHHAAGNATVQSVHNYHRFGNGWAGIGYHFYIHKDGTIYKGREENWRGAHAAEVPTSPNYNDGILENDVNATSLGISVQGDYMKETNMPKAQEDAIVEVGKYAVEKYGMSQVFAHGDYGIGQTSCPGKYYPFDRIKARILADSVYIYDIDNL